MSDTGRLSIHGITLPAQGAELYLGHELMVPCHEERAWLVWLPRGSCRDEVKPYLLGAV